MSDYSDYFKMYIMTWYLWRTNIFWTSVIGVGVVVVGVAAFFVGRCSV